MVRVPAGRDSHLMGITTYEARQSAELWATANLVKA